MKRLASSLLAAAALAALSSTPSSAQEIPYRYSILEGFILTIDDASRRAVSREDDISWAVLNGLAETLESDQFRIPVEYGRTLAWNLGTPIEAGADRESQLATYRQARQKSADRVIPARLLFLRLSERDGALTLRADALDLIRGESLLRVASEAVPMSLPVGCEPRAACASEAAVEALQPFFAEFGEEALDFLGRAPPRGYGEVPPPWLIPPISYRVDMRGLEDADAAELADAMTAEFDYYLDHEITREEEGRLTLQYETTAPSWWLADQLQTLGNEIDLTLEITPISDGLRIE